MKTSKRIQCKIVFIHFLRQYMGQGSKCLVYSIVILGTMIYEILFKNVLYINERNLSKTITAPLKTLVILCLKLCVVSQFIFIRHVYTLV
jgi:hypothetical protein